MAPDRARSATTTSPARPPPPGWPPWRWICPATAPAVGRSTPGCSTTSAVVSLLRTRLEPGRRPIALRGSSLGGYLAIVAAAHVDVDAVVAICPAGNEGLRRGLLAGRFTFAANQSSLAAVHSLRVPLLLLHAEGDEQVPVEHSRELSRQTRHAQSRLITVPGGHHRSVQHDPELQAVSLRWLGRVMGEAECSGP